MARPEVSVVMPFAGDPEAARAALDALGALDTGSGDELILADNAGTASGLGGARSGVAGESRGVAGDSRGVAGESPDPIIVLATGERSPAHARNVGAECAHNEWILFLDADCRAPSGLLDDYFSEPIAPDIGALAGEVVPAAGARTLAARYATSRSFLSQEAHFAHPFRPRAVAANLLVRRSAFEQVGGFYEGLRAAEDTDFSWRLQEAGWRLELRPEAAVEHRYRRTVRELRRQWRGYAAGRAWLSRRYGGFRPEPAASRALKRVRRPRPRTVLVTPPPPRSGAKTAQPPRPPSRRPGPLDRARFLALDALLAGDELAGFALSNRPAKDRTGPVQAVLVSDHFPAVGDPLVQLARTIDGARVEATARPESVDHDAAREVRIDYREDDGAAARAFALLRLAVRHPIRCLADVARRRSADPPLAAIAPAVLRLERERAPRVHGLGSDSARRTARRLAALTGAPSRPTGQ